jgi:hypothetical protein
MAVQAFLWLAVHSLPLDRTDAIGVRWQAVPHVLSASVADRVNTSDRDADYRGYYSDADAEVLADLCAEDIARFGYVF